MLFIDFTDNLFSIQEKPCRDGLQYSRTVNFDLEQTASRIEAMQTGEVQGSDKTMCGVFRAKIQPDSNAAAEDELRRVIRFVCGRRGGGGRRGCVGVSHECALWRVVYN